MKTLLVGAAAAANNFCVTSQGPGCVVATPLPNGPFVAMSTPSDPASPSVVVLVAEDEVLIRMMAVDVLTDAGFVVIEAAHADDALSLLASQAHEVRALFTDIHMPGTMTGLELAHHVRGNWPWIALLVASGKARPHADAMPSGSRFLLKPYDPNHLIQHVRELVDAGRAPRSE